MNGAKSLVAQNLGSYVRTAPDSSVQNWVIGHNENLSLDSDPWRGFLDNLRIYNRILFPSEAQALYNLAGLLPPSFEPQPQSTTLFLGETLWLSSSVDGSPPIALQWQRNGTNLPGATLSSLIIPGATAADAGNYTLIASNAVRTLTSAVAVVTIRPVTSITNGLAGYWKFDETSGSTAADSSGQGDAGTIVNGTGDGGQWTAGKVGGALQFRGPAISGGAADYVVVPAWPKARNGTMTLSAWVWADVLPADRADIACGGSGTDGIGQFLFTLSSGTSQLAGYVEDAALAQTLAQEPQVFPTNSWQHVALVADGAMLHVYRNGVEAAASSYSGTLYNPTNALSIGARLTADDSAGESGWWQGRIDEVAYWARGLSAGEIFELYAAGSAGRPVMQADAFTNAAPLIAQGPQPAAVYLHDPFALQVKAAGVAPLSFQWWFGAAPVPGATNSVCAKAAAEFADAGNYVVVVTAGNGLSVTSAPVALAVNAPAPALGQGLVLYLKLDETVGQTANDSSPNVANGTLVNFPEPDNQLGCRPLWQCAALCPGRSGRRGGLGAGPAVPGF